jgi:hypothetical protein
MKGAVRTSLKRDCLNRGGARGKCRGCKVGRNRGNGVRKRIQTVKRRIKRIKRRKLKKYAERDVADYSTTQKI